MKVIQILVPDQEVEKVISTLISKHPRFVLSITIVDSIPELTIRTMQMEYGSQKSIIFNDQEVVE